MQSKASKEKHCAFQGCNLPDKVSVQAFGQSGWQAAGLPLARKGAGGQLPSIFQTRLICASRPQL